MNCKAMMIFQGEINMKKYLTILRKPIHIEPSKVSYGGKIIRFRVTVFEDKSNLEIYHTKQHILDDIV